MADNKTDHDLESADDYKVRKRVARKVIKDIHHQVAEIELQVQHEEKSAKFIIPLLVLFALISVFLYVFWADVMRLLSSILY